MDNPDLLYLLTSRLRNESLRSLCRTPLWNIIKSFSTDEYWWYLRVQHLLVTNLQPRMNVGWKEAYRLLTLKASITSLKSRHVLDNPLVVSILLEAGRDPAADDNQSIQTACEIGNVEVVKLLLSDSRVDPNIQEGSPLASALDGKHLDIVKLLLAHPRIDPSLDGSHALKYCCDYGYLEIVQLLLSDSRVDPTADENAPLRYSAGGGHLDIVKLLLTLPGVDPTDQENSAIRDAAESGHSEVVKFLLTLPEVDPADDDNDAIGTASKNGHAEVVRLLLADPRIDPGANFNYALGKSARHNHVEVVRLLLADDRIDPTNDNNGAIRYASMHGCTEVVKLLLEDGRSDPGEYDNVSIREACEKGYTEVVRLLLADKRVDPGAQKNVTLYRSSQNCRVKIVKLYRSYLAPCLASSLLLADKRVDISGPITLAVMSDDIRTAKLLLSNSQVRLKNGGRDIMQRVTDRNSPMFLLLARSPAVDLQSLDQEMLSEILTQCGYTIIELLSNNYEKHYFYIFLRELLVKNECDSFSSLGVKQPLEYYLRWLIEQCERHPNALEYRRVIAEAAESYMETGKIVHTSPYFTAYSGFLLLAKCSDRIAILDLLSQEQGITQGGLELASLLISAYLGEVR